MPVPQMTRRRVVLTTGTIAALGLGAVRLSSDNVSASVSITEFDVPEKSHNTTDGEIQDVIVDVDSELSIDASAVPDSWELELQAGRTTTEPLSRVGGGFVNSEQVVEQSISGSLLTSSAFEIADFRPDEDTYEIDVLIGLEATIEHDGDEVHTARESITRTLEVVDPAQIQVQSEVGGSGELVIET